ncbi:MAG: hypothetical protein KDD66_07775 [Bdellovibrionales bacterium]|nr:hypothetical protein [Bdellovibrionales bacterium]
MEEVVGANRNYEDKGPLPESPKNLRVFGVGAGLILLVFWTLKFFYFKTGNSPVLLGLAAYFLISGVAVHAALKPVYRVWIRIAHKIGQINAYVFLFLIYYAVLTPIGFIMRALGKSPLSAMAAAEGDSFWVTHEGTPDKESYKREF